MTRQRYDNSDKSKQNVCLATIKEARDTRQMRALAAYYFFKQQFYKANLYDYRSRMDELASIVQVSTKTLYTYIHLWKRWGLAHGHKTSLVFTGIQKVKRGYRERRKYQITISDNETLQTIEARLNAKILEEHAGQMNFYRRLTRYLRNNKKQAPPPSSDTKITDCVESLPELPAFSLSLRNIGKLLNVSHIKAKENILILNDLGVITTTKTKPRGIGKAPANSVSTTEGLPGHFFYLNGVVYQVFGNRHIFNEHSPTNEDMTYKQFMYGYKNSKASVKKIVTDIHIHNSPKPMNLPH